MTNRALSWLLFAFIAAAWSPAHARERAAAGGDGGLAREAVLEWPSGVAVDADGNVFVADRRADVVHRVDGSTGIIATYAGNGRRGYGGDGGPAHAASIAIPELIALDTAGNLYIADRGNARVRRAAASTGVIVTVAGTGEVGYDGDGGPAAEAKLSFPFGVAVDRAGDLFVADTENHVIRRVDRATGRIATVAGSGEAGFAGDGGAAVAARLHRPHNLAIDPDGNLVIGDSANQRIRRVDRSSGRIETLYGSGEEGFSPDGIAARDVAFAYFGSLLYDRSGDLLVAGWVDSRIRRIDRETGIIETLCGTGEAGVSADGVPARGAAIHGPYGMAISPGGDLFFAEAENGRVRRIDAETALLTTVAGGGPAR